MELWLPVLTIIGLALFEGVLSIDNAVINADVLTKVSEKARKWFLFWGLLLAVFVVRGLLPWLIFWMANPTLGPVEAFFASFQADEAIKESVERAAPLLLMGGGVFLLFLFLHWLFMEPKTYGLRGEKFFHEHGVWFYAIVSIVLATVIWFAIKINPFLAFSATIGSSAFFITHGFKQNAELKEKEMLRKKGTGLSDWSKIMYLEVIDATFSIDGVIGAFAFTFSIPLILIGNGIGAFIVRKLTMSNIETVKKYVYLKNGAMYSVFVLGALMIAEAFGAHVPIWASPVATFAVLGYFFIKSRDAIRKGEAAIE